MQNQTTQPKTEEPKPKKLTDKKSYIEERFRIHNKRGELVPFKFNVAQTYYWDRKRRRNIILKARQKGITKIIDADQLVDVMMKRMQAVVISHEKNATQRLFASVREYIKNMKVKPTVSIDSKSEILFPFKGSSYFVGTAGAKAFGRGDTIGRAHLSEAAFYPDLKRMLDGIEEACELGQIDVESTPNGQGNDFHDMWEKAKSGLSSYTPIFIPWFIDGEYSVDNLSKKEQEGMSDSVRAMFTMSDEEFENTLDEKEKKFRERVKREWNIEITTGMMKWRRYKIWDKGESFFQEYPEDDVSCFLQSGRSVFKQITMDTSMKIPLDNIESWNASAEDKKKLQQATLYGGIDGALGTEGGDGHSFAVIYFPDKNTNKAYVIYEHTSNEPSEIFDAKVAKICENFNIQLGIENNGVGQVHVKEIRRLGIGFTEWTTGANRPVMISDLEAAYRKEELIETYTEAEAEARAMIYKGDRAEHPTGKHDDRIFARAIAWGMRMIPETGAEFF